MKSYGVALHMKPLQQYFHMVLINMQQVLLVTFDKILQKLPLK